MTVLFALGAEVRRADIPRLCADLAESLRGSPGNVVICDVSAAARPDVVLVEALARLRLTAGRHGWRFTVRGAPPDLLTLFALMGLGGFFAAAHQAAAQQAITQRAALLRSADRIEQAEQADQSITQQAARPKSDHAETAAQARQATTHQAAPRSGRLEPVGQAEQREQPLGVEEVVDPGDLAV